MEGQQPPQSPPESPPGRPSYILPSGEIDNLRLLAFVALEYMKAEQPGEVAAHPAQEKSGSAANVALTADIQIPVSQDYRPQTPQSPAAVMQNPSSNQHHSRQVVQDDSANSSQSPTEIAPNSPAGQHNSPQVARDDSANCSQPPATIAQNSQAGQRHSRQVAQDNTANIFQPRAAIARKPQAGQLYSRLMAQDNANRSQPPSTIAHSSKSGQRNSRLEVGGSSQPSIGDIPIIDLTLDDDDNTPLQRLNHPLEYSLFTCSICGLKDTDLSSVHNFAQHIRTHFNELISLKCRVCKKRFPAVELLVEHKHNYRKEAIACLPVVDINNQNVRDLLANLGVAHYVQLSQLQLQPGEFVQVPIIAIDIAGNLAQDNLDTHDAEMVLLGPLETPSHE